MELVNHVLEQKPATDLVRVTLQWLSRTVAEVAVSFAPRVPQSMLLLVTTSFFQMVLAHVLMSWQNRISPADAVRLWPKLFLNDRQLTWVNTDDVIALLKLCDLENPSAPSRWVVVKIMVPFFGSPKY